MVAKPNNFGDLTKDQIYARCLNSRTRLFPFNIR